MDNVRFVSNGIKTGFHNCNIRSLSLRLTRREWAIIQQAIRLIDCVKHDGVDPLPREIEWISKKIESKIQGIRVPKRPER